MSDQTTPAAPPSAEPLYVRVFIYVVATHVLLAFLSFLVIVAKTR